MSVLGVIEEGCRLHPGKEHPHVRIKCYIYSQSRSTYYIQQLRVNHCRISSEIQLRRWCKEEDGGESYILWEVSWWNKWTSTQLQTQFVSHIGHKCHTQNLCGSTINSAQKVWNQKTWIQHISFTHWSSVSMHNTIPCLFVYMHTARGQYLSSQHDLSLLSWTSLSCPKLQ